MTNDTLAHIIGFARYEKKEEATTEDLIKACLNWRREFLSGKEGILHHVFLGNLKGEFADVIFASNPEAFQKMAEDHNDAPSSQAFMELLNPETIRLTANQVLGTGIQIPKDFSCVEFGTFSPAQNVSFSDDALIDISRQIEDEYLSKFEETRAHVIAKIDDSTYSEISFVLSLGSAQEICEGYLQNPTCQKLLSLFNSESVDLDFWFVLA